MIKRLISTLIAFMPFSSVRTALWRAMPGITIGKHAFVGFGTALSVSSISIGAGSRIGRFNMFTGPMNIEIGNNCSIGHRNKFECGKWTVTSKLKDVGYERSIRIGDECLISSQHYFDGAGAIDIHGGTWVGGLGTQFWTHGVGAQDRRILIQGKCYIGSRSLVLPGAALGYGNLLAAGSTLTDKLSETSCALVAGIPAKAVKSIREDLQSGKIKFERNW